MAKDGTPHSIQHVPTVFVEAARRQPSVKEVVTLRTDPHDEAGEPETFVTFVKVPSLESALHLLHAAQVASQGEAQIGFQFADLLHELHISSPYAELIKSSKTFLGYAIYQDMAAFNTLLNEIARLRVAQGEDQPMTVFRRVTGAVPCLIAYTPDEGPHQPQGNPFVSNPNLGKVKSSIFHLVPALSFCVKE